MTKLSEIGLVPLDETAGKDNYNKLITALQEGIELSVDGEYYLSRTNIDSIIDAPIILKGENKQTSKLILEGSKLLMPKQSVHISDIGIYSETHALVLYYTGSYFGDITLENNHFEGNMRFMHIDKIDTLNWRIRQFDVLSNTFRDIYQYTSTATVFHLANGIIEDFRIEDNKVDNFANVLFNFGASSRHPLHKEMIQARKKLTIKRNTVINHDNWDIQKICPEVNYYEKYTYHCFIIGEVIEVLREGNHIEGLKCLDPKNKLELYDMYFKCGNLVQKGDTFKNIVNFSEYNRTDENKTSVYRSLMTAKSDAGIGKDIYRLYENNIFIIEADFADRFGKSRKWLFKTMAIYAKPINGVIIKNNVFKLYALEFMSYNLPFVQNYVLENNIFEIEVDLNGNESTQFNSFIYTSAKQPYWKTYDYLISGNSFKYKDKLEPPAKPQKRYFVRLNHEDGVDVHFVMKNNTFEGYKVKAEVLNPKKLTADIRIEGNTFKSKED